MPYQQAGFQRTYILKEMKKSYRIVKKHYRGDNMKRKHLFYIQELRKSFWYSLIGIEKTYWKNVQEEHCYGMDSYSSDLTFKELRDAEIYCINAINDLPLDPIIGAYTQL